MTFSNPMRKKGFTLVELMIVISVLGILASIVFSSMNLSRSRAKETAIQEDLRAIKTQADIYSANNSYNYGAEINIKETSDGALNPNGTYSGVGPGTYDTNLSSVNFCTNSYVQELIKATGKASGAPVFCSVGNGGTTYRVYVPLTDPTQIFCIDSAGAAYVIANFSDGEVPLENLELSTDIIDCP